ncbi:hypothetical protein A3H10_03255 [Candidatus Uhrbacteria bacterium RIFCSPLOWO2_12_FULL_46_10]|uniref:Hydrolase TatD n=1 Tax=Candidatus Uhrbacteria bacterium RIFCSPLOWO2_01_FULL_47_25 TaxID=1802402 RepID=A0A1F7UYC9_9BACT|nr:MAG: hypothetical protein UX68_C0014G0010 [Parcubacteria group bacterium GW2011_GWA2_46_9]OGL59861.1 MAG: hypothetical protein A2752_03910 [Candidatus Uhrbacteria bacterium RIFCSPHIGHO2_01_FULL_46_23]OGL69566.1 MAG: hypothetical protein A3D60_00160 [Candidatus Uhrbacteria bacterium RIFCSPHIGHO2_02_FULL_47_29]OGL76612.1 MAG: hypothetical protein A3E96_00500 [Candidatus Uhrbacteria bacterium RIFCSPHIGHO2_12_FULL_46_13]OGL82774.1 MAG: hypothetical protein A2936_05565 [Candidatus Uhrbacteria bac
MLFDSHAHAHFNAYKDDSHEVIQRALDKGVQMVLVGTQIDTSRKAIVTAEKYDGVWASVGLHPIHLEEGYFDPNEDPPLVPSGGTVGVSDQTTDKQPTHAPEPPVGVTVRDSTFRRRAEVFDKEKYRVLALSSKKVVAIGETGLDYYRLEGDEAQREAAKEKQRQVFQAQAELAAELDLALIVHCRNAHAEVLEILKSVKSKYPTLRGVIHCFTGTPEEGERYLDFGFYISFPGIITFAKDWDEFIREISLDKVLVETDCPYLTPVPHRGQRNEPAYVEFTAKHLANIKGVSFEEVAEVTTKNAQKLFRI